MKYLKFVKLTLTSSILTQLTISKCDFSIPMMHDLWNFAIKFNYEKQLLTTVALSSMIK